MASKKKVTPVVESPALASMKVEMWGVEQPVAYARNARKIPQKAIDKVAASLKEFGWRQPIVLDKDGVIVVGHTRLAAAKQLKLTHVPVHVAEDLTPAQIKAYRLADNRVSQETSWNEELLHIELEELSEEFADLNFVTGFDTDEIGTLLGFGSSDDADGDSEAEPSLDGTAVHKVVIDCRDEAHQSFVLQQIQKLGYSATTLNVGSLKTVAA